MIFFCAVKIFLSENAINQRIIFFEFVNLTENQNFQKIFLDEFAFLYYNNRKF